MLGLACVSVVTAGALVTFIAFVPTALPLLPPTVFMILLVSIYLPLVLLSMTLSPAEPGVMKATPHKNQLVLRDQGKFWSSLFLRSIPVALACVACVWWGLDVLLDEVCAPNSSCCSLCSGSSLTGNAMMVIAGQPESDPA
jgi:hypothetical protein